MKLYHLALLLPASPLAAQTVHVVGPSGYPTIQAAVDVAADGDLVLVENDWDTGFAIDGKSLSLLGNGASLIGGHVLIRIENLSGGERVVVRDFNLSNQGWTPEHAVVLAGNAGTVALEDLLILQGRGAGIFASGNANVVLSACTIDGFPPLFGTYSGDGGPGLIVTSSTVHAFDCSIHGALGPASGGVIQFAGDGGDGVVLNAALPTSLFTASGCDIRGGTGGPAVANPSCPFAGAGGDGLVADATPAFLHDTEPKGGQGGWAGAFQCDHLDGLDVVGSGPITSLPGEAMTLQATSPVSEGAVLSVKVSGPRLAPAFVGLGSGPDSLFLSGLGAALVIQGPYAILPLGMTDAMGAASVGIPLPLLPPGLQFSLNWGQAGYVSSSGGVVLGAPATVVILDQAY